MLIFHGRQNDMYEEWKLQGSLNHRAKTTSNESIKEEENDTRKGGGKKLLIFSSNFF